MTAKADCEGQDARLFVADTLDKMLLAKGILSNLIPHRNSNA